MLSVKEAEGDFKDVLVAPDVSLMNYLYVHLTQANFLFCASATAGEFNRLGSFILSYEKRNMTRNHE